MPNHVLDVDSGAEMKADLRWIFMRFLVSVCIVVSTFQKRKSGEQHVFMFVY